MAASERQRQEALLLALLGREPGRCSGSASGRGPDDAPIDPLGAGSGAGADAVSGDVRSVAPAQGAGGRHEASHTANLHRLGLRGVLAAAVPSGGDLGPVDQPPAGAPGPALAAGLEAYRGNAIALSARALAGAFPHLESLLGPQFASLAWAFWRQCPPAGGDLGTWGATLPAFLRETADEGLAGVAAFEWAIHEAERAEDAVLDTDSLNRLHGDPSTLGLAFRPGLVLLELPGETLEALEGHRAWRTPPVVTVHAPSGAQAGSAQPLPGASSTAPSALAEGVVQGRAAFTVLVWRKDWRGQATQLKAAPAAFMRSALAGHSLEAALAASTGLPDGDAPVSAEVAWDFTVFLQQALQEQWLTAVLPLDAAGGAKETHDVHLDESSAPPGRHGLSRRD